MRLHAAVLDDFMPDFAAVREWADAAKFEDVKSPIDGALYPGICTEIPRDIHLEVQDGLCAFGPVRVRTLFSRLSLAGVLAPHQAHTDAAYGEYTLILYLNRDEHCRGGTSLVRHRETLMDLNPTDEAGVAIWRRDMNVPAAWDIVSLCPMRPNRAFIFRADLFHRAEPIGGFGNDARDGRLVLTAFFDSAEMQ